MRDAVICEPLRTPVGRYGGTLARTCRPPTWPQPWCGTGAPHRRSRRGYRRRHLRSGLSQQRSAGHRPRSRRWTPGSASTVPGMQIDRRCGSGLQAVINAAMCVQTGAADLIIAGGAEVMSQAEYYAMGTRWGLRGRRCRIPLPHRARARHLRRQESIPCRAACWRRPRTCAANSRSPASEQDEFAVALARNARSRAQKAGRFADEIVPVTVKGRKGEQSFAADEHSARRRDDRDRSPR